MKILHVIIGLDIGGAELMLERLIKSDIGNPNYQHHVISLTTIGKAGRELLNLGVSVEALGMKSLLSLPIILWKLVNLIRLSNADVIQTWMYHSDLLGGIAARIAGNKKIIWGLRGTEIPQNGISVTRFIVFLCSVLSKYVPAIIVCCADTVKNIHAEKGYDVDKMIVIPNGYDLNSFHRDSIRKNQTRIEFGFSESDVVVGIVARFDVLKDHKNFIHAASKLSARTDNIKFLMVGRGMVLSNNELMNWIQESGIASEVVLIGERCDIPKCLEVMDVFCLSSLSEGFPNVVCESMAMQVPCVVTDVGDAAKIVSKTGVVVPSGDSQALADALELMVRKDPYERLCLGKLARIHVEKHYSIETAVKRFYLLYNKLMSEKSFDFSNIEE